MTATASAASAKADSAKKNACADRGTIIVPERVKIALRMLTAAADRGDECPPNAMIACAMGATSPSAASAAVALLEAMNIISVERGTCSRVVTIHATGKRTAGKIRTPHSASRSRSVWTRDLDAALMDAVAEEVPFSEIARELKTTTSKVAMRFDQLRARMGRQAA